MIILDVDYPVVFFDDEPYAPATDRILHINKDAAICLIVGIASALAEGKCSIQLCANTNDLDPFQLSILISKDEEDEDEEPTSLPE